VRLRAIGYWRSDSHPELPDPTEFVDSAWDPEERDAVAGYLRSGTVARAFMGYSPCRLCGEPNGSLEFTDGDLLWPEGLAHYLDEHGVRLPDVIVEVVMRKLDELDDVAVAFEWWTSATDADDN
jgi:hypothetical protein